MTSQHNRKMATVSGLSLDSCHPANAWHATHQEFAHNLVLKRHLVLAWCLILKTSKNSLLCYFKK